MGYSAADAPQPRPPPGQPRGATNLGPTFSNKMSRETRGRGAADHRSHTRVQFWGQQGKQRGVRGAAAWGAELRTVPACSSPWVPARRIRPPPPSSVRRAHPGLRAVKRAGTPGHPRAPESLGSPFGSGPVSCAYLRAGPGNTARSPGHVWCGVPEVLSVHPPNTKLRAGGRGAGCRLLQGLAAEVIVPHQQGPDQAL